MGQDIYFMEEYIWVIHDDLFNELRNSTSNHMVISEEEYQYKREVSVSFRMTTNRNNGGKALFFIKIGRCSKDKVDGTMSTLVDFNNGKTWNLNRYNLNGVRDGARKGYPAFDDDLLDSAQSLTIR